MVRCSQVRFLILHNKTSVAHLCWKGFFCVCKNLTYWSMQPAIATHKKNQPKVKVNCMVEIQYSELSANECDHTRLGRKRKKQEKDYENINNPSQKMLCHWFMLTLPSIECLMHKMPLLLPKKKVQQFMKQTKQQQQHTLTKLLLFSIHFLPVCI